MSLLKYNEIKVWKILKRQRIRFMCDMEKASNICGIEVSKGKERKNELEAK